MCKWSDLKNCHYRVVCTMATLQLRMLLEHIQSCVFPKFGSVSAKGHCIRVALFCCSGVHEYDSTVEFYRTFCVLLLPRSYLWLDQFNSSCSLLHESEIINRISCQQWALQNQTQHINMRQSQMNQVCCKLVQVNNGQWDETINIGGQRSRSYDAEEVCFSVVNINLHSAMYLAFNNV